MAMILVGHIQNVYSYPIKRYGFMYRTPFVLSLKTTRKFQYNLFTYTDREREDAILGTYIVRIKKLSKNKILTRIRNEKRSELIVTYKRVYPLTINWK